MTKATKTRILLALTAACTVLPSGVDAAYRGDTDTGFQHLDFIENERREERANRLTDEQKKLLADVEAMAKHLRHPVTADAPSPVAFEGDDLTYDERTGDFTAKGHVDIVQLEARRFQGDYVEGNTVSGAVAVPDRAHILQLTEGTPRVTLDGYRINYNYKTHEGTMADAKGKVGGYYMTGKRFEFYPDKVVVYDGTQTKCSAERPDYHLSADVAELYPGDKLVLTNVKFWIKNKVIFKKKRYVVDVASPMQRNFPTAGYDSEDGLWVEQTFDYDIAPRVTASANLYVTTNKGWRSHYDLGWQNGGASAVLTYGVFDDGDDDWIKKQPSFILGYGHRVGKTPVTYNLYSEYGRWYSDGIHSNHWKYGVSLAHDTIRFHGYRLDLAGGYSVTRESYDSSRVQGFNASVFLTKPFNERFAAYIGGLYSKSSKENSLFAFDQEDYSRILQTGLSYRIDEHNRIAVGTKYAVEPQEWTDVDYYWFHDLHCSQIILRYRSKQDSWKVKWEFTPW